MIQDIENTTDPFMSQEVISTNQDIKLAVDMPNGQQLVLLLNSEQLETLFSRLIDSGMNSVKLNTKDTKSLMMKASINSALIAIGPFLVDMLWYGNPDNKPKYSRKDGDAIEWHARYVVKQLVALERDSKSFLHLISSSVGYLQEKESNEHQKIGIRIHGFYSEPVSRTE